MKRAILAGLVAALVLGYAFIASAENKPCEEIEPCKEVKFNFTRYLSMGSGSVAGVDYPVAAQICLFVSRSRGKPRVRCNLEVTSGSVDNVEKVSAHKLDMGMVMSDVGYRAWHGKTPFKRSHKTLRSLFSLHPGYLTLVVRKDADIRILGDIRGKRINIGPTGTGQETIASELLFHCGIRKRELALAGKLQPDAMVNAFQDGKLDGYFYVVGHPNNPIRNAAVSTAINLVPLTGECVAKLATDRPYFPKTAIPVGQGDLRYRGIDGETPTYGVRATLLVSSKAQVETVYTLVKTVFENREKLKTIHPALEKLTLQEMFQGLTAPFHPGAKKYYRERGWLK